MQARSPSSAVSRTTARIMAMLGAVPLTAGIFVLAGDLVRKTAIDAFRFAATVSAIALCVYLLVLWLPYAVWRSGRWLGFAGVSALVVGQLIFWMPLWTMSGCGSNDILRVAQTLVCVGLWIAGCGLSWWGWGAVRLARSTRRPNAANPPFKRSASMKQRRGISPIAARLVLGFALVPLLPGAFFMTLMALEHMGGYVDTLEIALSYQVCAVLVLAIWLPAWFRAVEWNPVRRVGTLLLACLLLAVPWSSYWALSGSPGALDAFIRLMPFFALTLWFAGTAWLWCERGPVGSSIQVGPADPALRVICPRCEYDLRGLREVRCPECGWQATIDEFVLSIIARAAETD